MKIYFVSLGCDKNLVDSEVMLSLIARSEHELTMDPREAEVIVVNTCGFINDAKEESINTILSMNEYREAGKLKYLLATGCLVQRYKDEIMEEIEELDGIVGTTAYDNIVDAINRCVEGDKAKFFNDINTDPEPVDRINSTGGYKAYLKIAEGCNKFCTYCAIPKIRGKFRSAAMEDLVDQAEKLAAGGTRELILVAQETTLYGIDLYGKKSLPELIKRLAKIDGIQWIRILYAYPEDIDKELVDAMAKEPKVCHYIDMPIQSGSDRVLKRMGRRIDSKRIREIVAMLRESMPDIAIRTSIITGFPGETTRDHLKTMDLVDELEFDRLGVFTYSREEDTPAYNMDHQVRESTKVKRRDEIMLLQQEICFKKSSYKVGEVLKCIVDGYLPEEGVYIGRTYMDAPDVDGYIFIDSENELMSGDIVDVYVSASKEYDLIGEVRDEYSE